MEVESGRVNAPVTKIRRAFMCRIVGAFTAVTLSPSTALAASSALTNTAPRELEFHHLHTGEKLRARYWRNGDYDPQALGSINWVLRDFRTGGVHPIECQLLETLHLVKTELGVAAPFEVIGGYRSPKTNAMLRKRSHGVAKRSLHMDGRAIDVRIPGVRSTLLREVAADLRLGGVGYYAASNFVHLDTGRPRVW